MSRKSCLFILMLIASGCLSKACGDGQISTSPRSSEGEPTPDQPNVEEPVSGVTDVPSTVQPYAFVTPDDIGVTVGVGVIAAVPTEEYTGSCTLRDQTIENKVLNCTMLKVQQNVTIRNSIINLTPTGNDCIFMDRGNGSESPNFLLEHSRVTCFADNPKKLFTAFDDRGGYQDHSNWVMRNNVFTQQYPNDYFYIEGNLDGFLLEYNIFTGMGDPDFRSSAHFDGFQIAEISEANPTTGTMTIRGNYFDNYYPRTHKTAILFGTGGNNETDILFESNRVPWWGARPIWGSSGSTLAVKYNIFSEEFQQVVGTRCSGAQCDDYRTKPICCGYSDNAMFIDDPAADVQCNRHWDGTFIEESIIQPAEVDNVTAGCPPYAPREETTRRAEDEHKGRLGD